MTTPAQTGLAAALARTSSGAVLALAELSADDLMAQLSDEQKAGLSAALPAPVAASAEDMPKKKEGCTEDGDEDDVGEDSDPAIKPKSEASADRVKAVVSAVENDPACKGKAELALSMLADDDYAGLSASGLVKLLGKTPVSGGGNASDDQSEAAARAAMKEAIAETGNSKIDAGNGGKTTPQGSDKAALWENAIARNNPQSVR